MDRAEDPVYTDDNISIVSSDEPKSKQSLDCGSIFDNVTRRRQSPTNSVPMKNLDPSDKEDQLSPNSTKQDSSTYKQKIVWLNVFVMGTIHILALYGLMLIPTVHVATLYFTYVLMLLSTLGVQAGAHRLWSHRSYKANFGLRLFLSLCHVLALQNDLFEWCRDHRAHHKFSETDADPHDSSKGFFFSHVGWLLVRKHPDVIRKGATIDLQDLLDDPIVKFQRRYYIPMVLLIWGVMPTVIPVWGWNESVSSAMMVSVFVRYTVTVNLTWCVNSWAHMFGNRPYNKRIAPVEASIRHLLMGEGFHNYHHTFPWDYSASELGTFDVFNPATAAIDFFHWMGWAWDLKKVDPKLVEKVKLSSGDPGYHYKRNTPVYEWLTGIMTILCPIGIAHILHYTFQHMKQ